MQKSKKIITWSLVSIGLLLAIIFIAASVYINRFKPQLEDLLTRNIGMQTVIDGSISLKVFPGLSFAAHKVNVINNETYVLRVEKIEIAVDYTKLFSETIHVKELHFKRPQLYVIRDLDGTYNYETAMAILIAPGVSGMGNHEIDLSEFSVKDASVLYIDRAFGDTLKANGVYLNSDELNLKGTLNNFDAMKLKFKGSLRIDQFKLNSLKVDSMVFAVNGQQGKLYIKEESKPFLGGQVSGDILFDFNQKPVYVHNQHSVVGLDLDEFFSSINSKAYLSGLADYQFDLSFSSFGWSTVMSTMQGSFDLQGKDLTMNGIDLHKNIQKLTTAQSFSSVDLMAIFLAGPYGAVFSKGMDFEQLISGNPDDQTPIKLMSSSWKIEKGKAKAEDVALNTGAYRIALKGNLDLTTDQYQDLEIAIVNWEGCAAFSQKLNGSFTEPDTQGMLNLGLFKGPLDDLPTMLSRKTHLECVSFYNGSVSHP